MTTAGQQAGTILAPKFYEGPIHSQGDIHLRQRLFTYQTDEGLVSGQEFNIMFTLDRPASEVWPYVRDFNLWHNSYGYFYTGVLGDLYTNEDLGLGGQTFRINVRKANEPEFQTGDYVVLRVIPEHVMVVYQPVPTDGSNGGVSPGFHVVMLNEHDGKTTITVNMEHAKRTTDETEDEVVAYWRNLAESGIAFWRDIFIPNLKKLVYDS